MDGAAYVNAIGDGDAASSTTATNVSDEGGHLLLTPIQQKVATLCKSEERVMWAMSPTGSIGMSPGGTVYAQDDLEPLQKGKSLFQS